MITGCSNPGFMWKPFSPGLHSCFLQQQTNNSMTLKETNKILHLALSDIENRLPDHEVIIIVKGVYNSELKAIVSANREREVIVETLEETTIHMRLSGKLN